MTRRMDSAPSGFVVPMLALLALMLVPATGCMTASMLREKGETAYNGQRYSDAVSLYQQSLDKKPESWESQWGLGKALLAMGRYRSAEIALEHAYELRGEHEETPEVLDDLAMAYFQQGNRETTLRSFLRETTDRYQTSAAFLRQGEYLFKLGDVDAAVVAYRKAGYFADDGDSKPFVKMADFYEAVGDSSNAVQALRFAYWMEPETPGLANRFRKYGIVPGPTIGLEPPRQPKVRRGLIPFDPPSFKP